jgi:hypothetical protein
MAIELIVLGGLILIAALFFAWLAGNDGYEKGYKRGRRDGLICSDYYEGYQEGYEQGRREKEEVTGR